MSRPSWDEIWMDMAHTIAKRSLCSRAQVGCVLVAADNSVVAATYNGPSPKFNHRGESCLSWCERANTPTDEIKDPQSYANCSSTHAEASALIRADASRLRGATLYVSSGMCINCARLTAHSGVTRVVHTVDPAHAYRNPEASEKYLRDLGLSVERRFPTP